MANSIMSTVYNQFSSTYMQKKAVGRYDTHKRSELRTLCSSMAKVNRDAPIYLIDTSKESKRFVINLKEEARDLRNTIVSTLGDSEEISFNNKIAYSSNPNVASAIYIGKQPTALPDSGHSTEDGSVVSTRGEIPVYEIEVTALASPQVNLGTYLPMAEQGLEAGEYSFDINVGDMGYEFQFNISKSDTNHEVQKRLSRLINNSKIGLNASVEDDGLGNASLRIESVRVGIDYGQNPRIFSITDEETSKNSGAVSFLGLDYVAREASNAHFIVNGTPASATSNHFILQNDYEVTLNGISENEGQTTTIGVKLDTEALQDNISNLIGGYNQFIKSVSEYRSSQAPTSQLLTEMNRITGYYQQEMSKLGISTLKDGTLVLNNEQLQQSVAETEDIQSHDSIKALHSFSQSVIRKSNQIALNPVSYMNKTVVAYKNPNNTFLNPYVTSAYSGMFYNNYC